MKFTTKSVSDTLRIKRGNITVDIVSGSKNRIVVNDKFTTQTLTLDDNFNFDGAHFELFNLGNSLEIAYTSGLEALSNLFYNTCSFKINADNNYSNLEILAIGGDASLLDCSIFNLDSKVYLPTRNFNPEVDETNPWPIRETNDKKGCSGSFNEGLLILSVFTIFFFK